MSSHHEMCVENLPWNLIRTPLSFLFSLGNQLFYALWNGIKSLEMISNFEGQLQTAHIVWKLLKMSHLYFWILAFSTNFCPIRADLSGNTFWPQASGFQKLAKLDHFGIFNQLLSTQNVNVARFARNVEWDFFCDFQTPWILWIFVHSGVRCVALQGVVIM